MPDDASIRAELALVGPSGGRFLLLSETASKLLELVVSGRSPETSSRRVMRLAAMDSSFLGWLMDCVTGGYRSCSSGESLREPVAWSTVETDLERWVHQSLMPLIGNHVCTVQLTSAEYEGWNAAQSHLKQALNDCEYRAAESLRDQWDARALWTNYLFTWIVGLKASDGSVGWWSSRHCLADDVRKESSDWLNFAQSVVDRLDEMPQPSETSCLSNSSSARAVCTYEKIFQRLHRLEELESRFDEALECEKIAAMKELAYGASHEINNPLANISSRAQMLLRGEQDAERRRVLATINSQAFRAHEMIADMMLFAKPPKLQRETIDWAAFVKEVFESCEYEIPAGIRWNLTSPASDVRIEADPAQLATAIHAVWKNAIEAVGETGEISVYADDVDTDSGDVCRRWAQLEVRDTGPGIRPEVRRHLFDPFYSGREAGRGLGFGLSKAWSIVDLHGGTIIVHSDIGGPTSITIRLPATDFGIRA